MRGRAAWAVGCLALLLPSGSAWAGTPLRLTGQGHSQARMVLVANYGQAGGSHSGGFAGHSMMQGGYSHQSHGFPAQGYQGQGYAGQGRFARGTVGYVPYYGSTGVVYGLNYYGTYGLGPVYMPAGMLFGPDPLMQGIGNLDAGDPGFVAGPRVRPAALPGPGQPQPAAPAGNAAPMAARKVRVTNAAAKARAGKFMQAGDAQFAKQKFHPALERYREAALAAPDMAECFLRQGFAQVALGQYEAAAKVFQRALRLKGDWTDSDIELATIYGANHLAKLSHREGLAQAIEQNPTDAGLLIAMAAMLYFDGQRDRSLLFFQKAAQLGGNEAHELDGFLVPAPAPAEADEKPDRDAVARPAGKVKL